MARLPRLWLVATTAVAGCPAAPGDGPDGALAVDGASTWATYVIAPGDHDATVRDGRTGSPWRGFVELPGRDYRFAFDASAAYVLTAPVEPTDQLDWNKLPGLSDCETIDLAIDGAMFGWRWRVDVTPPRLEVTAYANAARAHQWPAEPLFALDAAELAAGEALRYRVWPDGEVFRFAVRGAIGVRTIDVATTLPRACPATSPAAFKWASGLYFGGTSVAPTQITGRIDEIPFVR